MDCRGDITNRFWLGVRCFPCKRCIKHFISEMHGERIPWIHSSYVLCNHVPPGLLVVKFDFLDMGPRPNWCKPLGVDYSSHPEQRSQ